MAKFTCFDSLCYPHSTLVCSILLLILSILATIDSKWLVQTQSITTAQAQAQAKLQPSNKQTGPNKNGSSSPDQAPVSNREKEKQIVDKILGEGYDKRIRPAGNRNRTEGKNNSRSTDEPTLVHVNTFIRSISKIDDVTMEYYVQLTLRQEWYDDRLAFGTMAQYRDLKIQQITLTEQERIWKPDLFFRNEKEGHFHKIIMPNVLLRINDSGLVLYSIRISLVLACPMDLKYYPLDRQNCTIEMASYGYTESDLEFKWKSTDPVQVSTPLNLPRFALEHHDTAYCTSITSTGRYSCLRIDLIFKREFSYYLIQIYIPCCMLVIVSWVSFWLDPNAIPARVSLGVTTLLTMATQISGINASLPPVSYTKAIDVWTGVCLTFVFSALLEFALVNYASRSDQHKREMLSSALTQTQKMRWREAAAVAASIGVAPPTSPPPDENSPSALRMKQGAFFAGPLPQTHPQISMLDNQRVSVASANVVGGPNPLIAGTYPDPNTAYGAQIRDPMQTSMINYAANDQRVTTGPARFRGASNEHLANTCEAGFNNCPMLGPCGINGRVNATQANNVNTLASVGTDARPPRRTTRTKSILSFVGLNRQTPATEPNGPANPSNAGQQKPGRAGQATISGNSGYQCPIHCCSPEQKRENFCLIWLRKFPTRSKRIDVISRIFFPLKFALFNLVYWTTYLFREGAA